MWEDLADTLEPVSATKPMPVNVITGGGGGPVTVADGDDEAEGTTTDAAVTSDTDGTVIGFLRGLVKILASVWDSLNGRLKVDASAVAVPVTDNSGSLTVDDGGGSLTVDGPLTDAQLRAAVVPIGDGGGSLTVDGTVAVTDGGGSLTVDGALTDTELRATPVPVSGTVAATQSGTWTVQPGNTANTTAWLVTSGHGKTIKTVTGSIASNGNNDNVITAVSSKRLKIIAISLRTAYTTLLTATLKNQTTDSAIWTEVMQAVSGTLFGATQAMPAPSFFCATIAGEALRINLSAAQTVYYNITYFDDDAS